MKICKSDNGPALTLFDIVDAAPQHPQSRPSTTAAEFHAQERRLIGICFLSFFRLDWPLTEHRAITLTEKRYKGAFIHAGESILPDLRATIPIL